MMAVDREPWIVRSGRWLTKRRGVILAPLFAVVLVSARAAGSGWVELGRDLLGMLCLFAGTRLRLVAASYHESEHGHSPITAGPYAWIRHPLYVANFLLGFGIVVLAGWWPMALVYGVVFFPIHAIIMRAEEVHLTRLYGESYAAYHRAVPAVIPWRRYRGPREGQRNEFKLRRGHERLKVVGYTLGVSSLLMLKQWRQALAVVTFPPVSAGVQLVACGLTLSAVIYRARLRRAWVRGAQTALAVASALVVAIPLPGVWPSALPTRAPAGGYLPSPPPLSAPPPAASSTIEAPAPPLPAPRSAPELGESSRWDLVSVLVGAATFGIMSVAHTARADAPVQRDHEFNEAGQAAVLVAVILGLWQQWQAPRRWAHPSERAWRLRMGPALEDGRVAIAAILKRRF